MNDFVDPADTAAVETVLASALSTLGIDALLDQLAAVPELEVRPARTRGLFQARMPGFVGYGDRRLVLDTNGATLEHLVGGVVLARDPVSRAALPGTLAALVCRSVAGSGAADDVSVQLTSLRDAMGLS